MYFTNNKGDNRLLIVNRFVDRFILLIVLGDIKEWSDILRNNFVTIFILTYFTDVENLFVCSHGRSLFYYTEALASGCVFWGVRPNIYTLWKR
jgi:hypothetical protein